MVIKRPFPESDWQGTPRSVQAYVERLEVRLNQNSRNSSKPPSSDPPFNKSKPADGQGEENNEQQYQQRAGDNQDDSKTKPGKRKRGGQKGHKGHQQKLLAPDLVIQQNPSTCSCGCTSFDLDKSECFYTHQNLEIPEIKPDVTHIAVYKAPCMACGRIVKGVIPTHYQTGYGPRLTALIAELSGILGDARMPVQTFCFSVLGFYISLGAIQRVIDRASEAISPIYEEIAGQVRQFRANHVDETSFFQGGKLIWLWVMVNTQAALFMIHAHRSKEAFLELIGDWKGILISDNYGVYRKWAYLKQTCLAHLIRTADGLSERKDEDIKKFGQHIAVELRLLCHWANAPPTVDEEIAFIGRLVKLLLDHHEREDDAGKFARTLLRTAKSLWTFLDEHGLEPTNNRAERALRFAVLWRKRSKGTQSEKGNRWVERILSLKETCRLRSVSTYSVLIEAVEAYFKEQKPNLDWLIQD